MKTFRLSPSAIFVLLGLAVLASGRPAEASHYRYADVRWCMIGLPEVPTFFIKVAERRYANQNVGDLETVLFDFGDGTSAFITLTVTEVHGDWFLAEGQVSHSYSNGAVFHDAGIVDCCRINGTDGDDALNNRNDGNFHVTSRILPFREGCSPVDSVPPIVWLPGGLGDTFTIPIPATDPDDDPIRCRFATDAEAGGGPNPAGMTIDEDDCVITWTPPAGDLSKFWTTQVKIQELDAGGTPVGATAVDFLLRLDDVPPFCAVQDVDPGPPTTLSIFIQDSESGLASINVQFLTNADLTIPAFAPGHTGSLIVIAEKIDETQSARVQLRVTDVAGNVTECDPVITEQVRQAGKPETHTYTGIPPAEHVVTVYNGDPGLTHLSVEVNGVPFKMNGLAPGEVRTLDVQSAVVPGSDSTFTLTTRGKPGGSAVVMIWEGNGGEH